MTKSNYNNMTSLDDDERRSAHQQTTVSRLSETVRRERGYLFSSVGFWVIQQSALLTAE